MVLLQRKHINYQTWAITLPAENTKGGKSTGEDQITYAMTERLRKVLNERRFLAPDGYVFGNEEGRCIKSFSKRWTKLFETAGLPAGRSAGFVWHSLRHEFISDMADRGANPHELKELARHKDIRTTERYLKAKEEKLRELLARKQA